MKKTDTAPEGEEIIMTAGSWLIAANAALWIGLGLYVARLASAQKKLERRIALWEQEND